ncbi:HD domain-containing protein [Deinococcus sonorensis]|uniref:HD domain-containing protein n=2 Tax=Deinococcus sonorensis TaxID=309891 RepID=A0AAU7UF71_9DEIO
MSTFPLTDDFLKALELAHGYHLGQYRKGTDKGKEPGIPYISHLLGVASIALEYGATEPEAIAALLHDALEDGPNNTGRDADELRQEIVETFHEGVLIAHLVDGATDDAPKASMEKRPWRERKLEYLARLPGEEASALLVSASDKLHNARAILSDLLASGPVVFTRFNQGRDGTLQYYRLLADTYLKVDTADVRSRPRLHALFVELERTVTALESACGVTADEVRPWPLLSPAAAS